MCSYRKNYVFPLELTDTWKEQITTKTRKKLTEMLGVEVDNVMAEYVIVMVGNKKKMEQIARDLVDFIGEESAEQFVAWLAELLPTFEARASANPPPAQQEKPVTEMVSLSRRKEVPAQVPEETKEVDAPSKRVINLKGLAKSSSESCQKKVVSLSSNRGTIRSLNSSKIDMDDVIARRAQRFGVVEKAGSSKSSSQGTGKGNVQQRDDARASGKRRTNERESSTRLSKRLGPPVNVDQAELDARDTLGSHKKRRGNRDHRDRDQVMEESVPSSNRRNSGSRDVAPPLPPSDEKGNNKDKQGHRQKMGPPPMCFQGGPMGFGGFPPPFGGPMFYPPSGYGPMNPYSMGFPPQVMPPYGGRGYARSPGEMQSGPRGPRPFQNRKWINPNVAKAEEVKANESKSESLAAGGNTNGASSSYNASFAPRNPYFSLQMRPRFQNKTWVRQDPAKDEELNSSLPKTPPKELLESTE
ncbi:hypothetical protein PsorP6_012141 [Peronosclerospora sorghi]|uniref:Uncharacterized protein n=1 Tax=Peronosclerospora sorghi TaxID=230839 RepID=A0ACC0WJI2_9STRA|nr:hypothetical protein PsorP6_012141 [Peronosclerospora sorghi]